MPSAPAQSAQNRADDQLNTAMTSAHHRVRDFLCLAVALYGSPMRTPLADSARADKAFAAGARWA